MKKKKKWKQGKAREQEQYTSAKSESTFESGECLKQQAVQSRAKLRVPDRETNRLGVTERASENPYLPFLARVSLGSPNNCLSFSFSLPMQPLLFSNRCSLYHRTNIFSGFRRRCKLKKSRECTIQQKIWLRDRTCFLSGTMRIVGTSFHTPGEPLCPREPICYFSKKEKNENRTGTLFVFSFLWEFEDMKCVIPHCKFQCPPTRNRNELSGGKIKFDL